MQTWRLLEVDRVGGQLNYITIQLKRQGDK